MNHLSDAAFERLLSGRPVSAEDQQHLDGCLVCRRELEAVSRSLAHHQRDLSEHEPDWEAQKAAIMDRLPTASVTPIRRTPHWNRRIMAAAATLFVAIGVGWMVRTGGDTTAPQTAGAMPVEEILATADTLLADDDIPGFGLIDPFAESEVDFDLLLDGENS
jgi:hypothetical protein